MASRTHISLSLSVLCHKGRTHQHIYNIYNILILSKHYLSTKIHPNIESSTNIFLLFCFVAKITWGHTVDTTWPTMDSAFRLYSCVIVNLIDLAKSLGGENRAASFSKCYRKSFLVWHIWSGSKLDFNIWTHFHEKEDLRVGWNC